MNHLFELPRLRRIAAGVSLACLFGTAGLAQASVADHHEFEATLHVPFKGGGPAIADVVAGQTQIYFGALVTVMPFIQSGRLKLIAVGGSKRNPNLPNVPLISETVPGYEVDGWYGLLAPKATPASVIKKLNAELAAVLALPEMKERLLTAGIDARASSPAEFHDRIAKDIRRWSDVVKQARIAVE